MHFAIYAKRLILAAFVLLIGCGASFAQLPVVIEPAYLEWDHDAPEIVEEFRMYCNNAPNVEANAANLKASIANTTQEWAITLAKGDWYCVVTAAIPSESIESAPSNEIGFQVAELAPYNLRIRINSP